MQIQVNTDSQVKGSEQLARSVEATVEASLARFADRITRVEVHLGDENSRAKAGGDDKRCVMEARLASLRPISVTAHAPTVDQAVNSAGEKLEQALERALGRLNDPRNRTLDR